jgi:outer membrane lipoprotein SlyB
MVLCGFFLLVCSRAQAQQPPEDDGAIALGAQSRMVRGTVTAAEGDRLTVKTDAGDLFQVVVTTNTRLIKERQPVKIADVHVGDGVGAMGVIDAPTKTVHAAMVMVVDAAQVKKMRDDMGKTYISGKVMAIDDLELTIKRQDGVTQKIAVDEGTSFRKGGRGAGAMMRGDGSQTLGSGAAFGPGQPGGPPRGESITLADIKVGDVVVGPGALKSGVFVPTQLTVIDAAAMGRRRRSEGGESGTAPATPPAATNPH